MKVLLKDATKDYFERPQLAEHTLKKLQSLSGDGSVEREGRKNHIRRIVGASIALMVVSLLFFLPHDKVSIQQKIAQEVAKKHLKMEPLDISASTVSELRRQFVGLEFVVTQSQWLSRHAHMLTGARLSSIQGVAAAQLRFKTEQGEMMTLYETGYDSQRFGVLPEIETGAVPVTVTVNGVRVNIWQENGLLMASALNLP